MTANTFSKSRAAGITFSAPIFFFEENIERVTLPEPVKPKVISQNFMQLNIFQWKKNCMKEKVRN